MSLIDDIKKLFQKKDAGEVAGRDLLSAEKVDVKKESKSSKSSSGWSGINVLETNLIKGEATVHYDWKKYFKSLFSNMFLSAILVAAAYGGLIFWSKTVKQNTDLETEISVLNDKRGGLEKNLNEIDDFKKKLEIARVLLDNHIYWEGFFDFMERNLLNDVYIPDSFAGAPNGNYSFSAKTDSYGTMIDQIFYLRANPLVKKVDLSGASYDFSSRNATSSESGTKMFPVTFGIGLELDPNIFYQK